jgi:hypothetical protein
MLKVKYNFPQLKNFVGAQQSDGTFRAFPSVIFTNLSLCLTLCLIYDRIKEKSLQGGIRLFTHKCEMCGIEFQSKSNRAKYCIYCRDKAQVLRNKAYKEKKLAGEAVAVGSEQVCPICGKTYTVTSGSQKYCKDCMAKKRKKTPPSAEYIKKNYDYIRFNVPKGDGDAIKAYAQEQDMTIKQLLLTALEEYKKNHESK